MHATNTLPLTLEGQMHSRLSRAVAASLWTCAGAALPAIALGGLVLDPELFTPAVLLGTILVFAAMPAALAWLIGRACAARVTVDDVTVVLERRDVRVEVPRSAIAGAIPWAVPLPGPGVRFALASGRRLAQQLALGDPDRLLAALGQDTNRAHPVVIWARERARQPAWRWFHRLWKFGGFALLPAAVLFRAHQWIAYGGTFGQWYLQGRTAWFRTLAVYWLVVAIYLVLWAACWRAAGEAVALAAAVVAPSSVARVRRAVDIACRVAFYAGVPALVAARFLA